MLKDIYLHGSLAEKYGEHFKFDINSAKEAIDALCSQLKGFRQVLSEGCFEVHRDTVPIVSERLDTLFVTMNNCQEIHIIPRLEGAGGGGGKGGMGKILLGAVLVAGVVASGGAAAAAMGASLGPGGAVSLGAGIASLAPIYGQVALLGGAMILGGVSQMLSPVADAPDITDRESGDTERNGILGGRGNTSAEGATIPVCIGRRRIGSHIIQVGMVAEKMNPVDWIVSDEKVRYDMLAGSRTYPASGGDIQIGARPELHSYTFNWQSFDDNIFNPNEDTPLEDQIPIPPYGTLSGYTFRNIGIYGINQTQENGTGDYYLDVNIGHGNDSPYAVSSLRLDSPLDPEFFDRITITENYGSSPAMVANKVTLGVDEYKQKSRILPDTFDHPPEIFPSSLSHRTPPPPPYFTRWRWNMGSTPFLISGNNYYIDLEYSL